MTPYWESEDGRIQLFLGDCREVLPALGVTADLVLADPPYGETTLVWDRWPDGWLQTVAEVSRSLWCFGSMRMFLERVGEFEAAGWRMSQDIVWEKANGTGFAADRFKRVHESALHWYQGDWSTLHHDTPRFVYAGASKNARIRRPDRAAHTKSISPVTYHDDGTRLTRSVLFAQSARGGHPTQKPSGIIQPLLEYACPPGGLVVDPFAGSGSTLVTAQMCGRRAIGIEGWEPYAEAAARRLSQMPLVEPDEPCTTPPKPIPLGLDLFGGES